jgi:predicted nucleic acid-binding Zn ribbon protein
MCDECYDVSCSGQCTTLTGEETSTLMGTNKEASGMWAWLRRVVMPNKCIYCNKRIWFKPDAFCSDGCLDIVMEALPKPYLCVGCGKPWIDDGSVCSEACWETANKEVSGA